MYTYDLSTLIKIQHTLIKKRNKDVEGMYNNVYAQRNIDICI